MATPPSSASIVPSRDDPDGFFTAFSGNLETTSDSGFDQVLPLGQTLEMVGVPGNPQVLPPAGPDMLDTWSLERDQMYARSTSLRYVSPHIPGAWELDSGGDWQPASDYGPVWFPRVAAGWQPYHNGHWVNHAPWGWMWVEDEPWGYAPFHYGRWVVLNGRWGWIPGPVEAHPIFAPALVVFAGGIHFGGVGVSVWFPLGPGEPYRPWYPCSPHYIDEVNISNIRPSRVVHVETSYVKIVNVTNITNITYVNRTVGVTAMSHDDFASGRSANKVSVKIDAHQMDHITVLDKPEPKPTAASFVGHAPAHPVPVKAARPVMPESKPISKSMAMPAKTAPAAKPEAAPKAQTAPMKPEAKTADKSPAAKPMEKAVPEAKTAEKTATPPAKPAAKPADKDKKTNKRRKKRRNPNSLAGRQAIDPKEPARPCEPALLLESGVRSALGREPGKIEWDESQVTDSRHLKPVRSHSTRRRSPVPVRSPAWRYTESAHSASHNAPPRGRPHPVPAHGSPDSHTERAGRPR